MELTPEEQKKQEYYRDARTGGYYGDIWTTVGKCVFCDMRDKYIVHEENGIVLTVALFAYIDGNLMIVPRRHIKSVKELTESEWQTVRKFMYLAKKIIRKTHNLKDIQYVIRDGGTAVNSTVQDHLHIHCIPSDAPDLTVWNYRKLKFTPLENAELFRSQSAKIANLGQKFDAKYKQQNKIEVNCNLLIPNSRNEILFHERPSWAKIGNDWISPPGGMVKDFGRSLEEELAREVQEETGLRFDPTSFELVASSVEKLKRYRQSKTNNTDSSYTHQFLWNIYVLKDHKIKTNTVLTPGDDAVKMIWVPLQEVPDHPRISPGVKQAIAKATL